MFNEAETLIKEQKRDLFATTDLVIPGGANTNLNKVIEKCSRILQFGYESDYVDDALLIIGKSFYYQKNYLKGIRKFQELLATQPESDLLLETELWIGKCQMKMREEKKGLETLKSVRAKAILEGEDEIIKISYVEEIIYYISKENNQSALTLMNEFLEVSENDEVNAEIVYQAGKLYLVENDVKNAIISFEKVFDYSPSYDIEQDAKIRLAMALREGGEKEKALEIFESMRDEDKYSLAYDILDLEAGITLFELGRVEEAVEKLTIVDTSYANSTSSGAARYMIGEIYENSYNNYDSAATYYAKATASAIPEDYKTLALEKSKLFKKYGGLRVSIDSNEKQLFYLKYPDEFTRDSIEYVQDSLSYIADSLKNVDVSHLFEMPRDITKSDTTLTDSTLISGVVVDSTLKQDLPIDSIKTKRPIVKRGDDTGTKDTTTISSVVKPKLVRPVKTNISSDSLHTLIAKDQLELGNLFLTELHRIDSAYYYYNNILTELSGSQYQARTLYALGTYYLTENRKEKADSLFSEIYDNYKGESIVNAAANQLNKPLIDLESDPARDLYAQAELKLSDSKYEESFKQFYNIYQNFPASSFAPKALYASGWILENNLMKPDSAVIIYDTMSVKYPASVYASQIRPKLTFYKQEKERIRKVIEDSLLVIKQLKADSLKADSLKKNPPVEIKQNIPDSLKSSNPVLIEEIETDSTQSEIEKLEKEEEDGEGKDDGGIISSLFGTAEKYLPPKCFNPGHYSAHLLRC